MDLFDIRTEHSGKSLDEKNSPADPYELFTEWFFEAKESGITEPNAMTLATSDKNSPSARIVLLKKFDHKGFYFFTNYKSRKGKELKKNENTALLFYWDKLFRQVRIEGFVKKIKPEDSDFYFNERPYASRISAIVSPQSEKIIGREKLEEEYRELLDSQKQLLRPENWGGYIVKPFYFEFWQGQNNRLHDRIVYEKVKKEWKKYRLAP